MKKYSGLENLLNNALNQVAKKDNFNSDIPDYLGQKITKVKCSICKERHEVRTAVKSNKYGLVWKVDSPCHKTLTDNMATAFNKLNQQK